MIVEDDRTESQLKTHRYGVVARDKFMSGWGLASDGASRVAWACESLESAENHYCYVRRNRDEMVYVNLVCLDDYRPPRGTAHFHIYVHDEG